MISFDDVSLEYRRRVTALRHVTLRLDHAGLFGLVGPNGAGKTSMLRLLLGHEGPSAGSVRILGANPSAKATKTLGKIAYVAQQSPLYDALSARQHIAMAASLRHDFQRIEAEKRLRDLSVPMDRPARHLSGGQRAQVAVTLALGIPSQVLLLDEPLAALDPLARAEFLSSLRSTVMERGLCAILSSHVVSDIESSCDEVVVLAAGRILLHDGVVRLRRTHRIVRAEPESGGVRLHGRLGFWLARVSENSDGGRRPTLEQVVVSYLDADVDR